MTIRLPEDQVNVSEANDDIENHSSDGAQNHVSGVQEDSNSNEQ